MKVLFKAKFTGSAGWAWRRYLYIYCELQVLPPAVGARVTLPTPVGWPPNHDLIEAMVTGCLITGHLVECEVQVPFVGPESSFQNFAQKMMDLGYVSEPPLGMRELAYEYLCVSAEQREALPASAAAQRGFAQSPPTAHRVFSEPELPLPTRSQSPLPIVELRSISRCEKCGAISPGRFSKYCGDGSDKDNEHQWRQLDASEMICVASRASVPERSEMWRELRRRKHWPIRSSWIDEAGPGETEDFGKLWQRIAAEIADSCGLVLYATADDMPLRGAFVEVGMTLAMGKRVGVYFNGELEERTCRPLGSWVKHPLCRLVSTLREARDWVEKGVEPPDCSDREENEGG